MALLELHEVTKRYAPTQPPAADGLSLEVEEGEIVALLGPSGCGKSTALRLIAGFETPDAGTILVRGEVVAGPGRLVPPEARGIGIVFQDYALFPHLTVEDNVAFGLHRLERAERRRRVTETLELVGLAGYERRYPHELSGGQQQRVAVARALAPAPAVLLLDEPFSNLDADLRAQMRDEVERVLRDSRSTAIFVTHDQQEAFVLADRVAVMHAGRIEQLDTPEDIYHHPMSQFVAEFVGAVDFLPGVVTARGIETELGVFPNVEALDTGADVEIMLRPDDVAFAPDPEGQGVIARRDFLGSETIYVIELASGRRVHSSQSSASAIPAGTRVRAQAEVLHVVTFPAPAPPPRA